jgi:hypothetical protein
MNGKMQAGVFAPLVVMTLATAAQAGPFYMQDPSTVPHPHVYGNVPVNGNAPTSFDIGAAELRKVISQREHSGLMSAERADRLNKVLDRAIAMRDQYVAQGRRLTPEQLNTLGTRLNGIRAAVRQRLQYY